MADITQLLEHALALTRAMLAEAKAASWQQVMELEQQRAQALEQLGALDEYNGSETLQSLLQELISVNTELVQLCQQEKQAVATQLTALSASKQALDSYTRS